MPVSWRNNGDAQRLRIFFGTSTSLWISCRGWPASINGRRLSDISAAVLNGSEYRGVDHRVTVSISIAIPTCLLGGAIEES